MCINKFSYFVSGAHDYRRGVTIVPSIYRCSSYRRFSKKIPSRIISKTRGFRWIFVLWIRSTWLPKRSRHKAVERCSCCRGFSTKLQAGIPRDAEDVSHWIFVFCINSTWLPKRRHDKAPHPAVLLIHRYLKAISSRDTSGTRRCISLKLPEILNHRHIKRR